MLTTGSGTKQIRSLVIHRPDEGDDQYHPTADVVMPAERPLETPGETLDRMIRNTQIDRERKNKRAKIWMLITMGLLSSAGAGKLHEQITTGRDIQKLEKQMDDMKIKEAEAALEQVSKELNDIHLSILAHEQARVLPHDTELDNWNTQLITYRTQLANTERALKPFASIPPAPDTELVPPDTTTQDRSEYIARNLKSAKLSHSEKIKFLRLYTDGLLKSVEKLRKIHERIRMRAKDKNPSINA